MVIDIYHSSQDCSMGTINGATYKGLDTNIREVVSGWGSCVFSEASVCNNSIRVVVFIELVDIGV